MQSAPGIPPVGVSEDLLHVGLTMPADPDADMAAQAESVFERMLTALAAHDADAGDVVRTRLFVNDMSEFLAVAAAHAKAFAKLGPATAMMVPPEMAKPGVRIMAEAVATRHNNAKAFKSGSKLEEVFGYSAAVRAGDQIFITGTIGTTDPEGKTVDANDFYTQTKIALLKTARLAESTGASLKDVVQTRIFIRDFTGFEDVARAHREVFGDILPATTLIAVKSLFKPEMAVEVEADIYLGGKRRIGSDSKWEPWFGFSRTFLTGRHLRISGSTGSTGSGETIEEQTEAIIGNLERAMQKAGHDRQDTISLRVFARNAADEASIREILEKYFDVNKAAYTFLTVPALAGDAMLLEIEAETFRE